MLRCYILQCRDRTTPGGIQVINQVFLTLAKHEERLAELENRQAQKKKNKDFGSQIAALRDKLQKALLIVIVMFSEANRFRCICKEIVRRIKAGEDAYRLDATMWRLINDWGTWSDFVLRLWAKDPSITMEADLPGMEPDNKRRRTDLVVRISKTNEMKKLKTVNDIIGPKGQLMLIKLEEQYIIHPSDMKKRVEKRKADDVRDPMFEKEDQLP